MEGTDEEILAYKANIVRDMFKLGVYNDDMDDKASIAEWNGISQRRAGLTSIHLPATQPTDITMAYLVKNRDMQGKFDVEKARALGLPAGPLYTQLKNGMDVEISVVEGDNTVIKTVKSEDVLGPSTTGPTVLIIDIPGLKYVNKVLRNDMLNSEEAKNSDIVVHMLADEVASDSRYIKWMESFKKSTKVHPRAV
jgi:hypothetical protein